MIVRKITCLLLFCALYGGLYSQQDSLQDSLEVFLEEYEFERIADIFEENNIDGSQSHILIRAALRLENDSLKAVGISMMEDYFKSNKNHSTLDSMNYLFIQAELARDASSNRDAQRLYLRCYEKLKTNTFNQPKLEWQLQKQIASNYRRFGNYNAADSLLQIIVDNTPRLYGHHSMMQWEVSLQQARQQYELKNNEEAVSIFNNIESWISKDWVGGILYIEHMNNKAIALAGLDRLDESIAIMQQLIKLLESKARTSSKMYCNLTSNLSSRYFDQEKYDLCLAFNQKAEQGFIQYFGTEDHPAVAATKERRADLFTYIYQRYDEAIVLYKTALAIRKEFYKTKNSNYYPITLKDIGVMYVLAGELDSAQVYLNDYYTSIVDDADRVFEYLSEDRRDAYVSKNFEGANRYLRNAAMQIGNQEFIDLQYEAALEFKGLSLKASQTSLTYMLHQVDTLLVGSFNKYQEVNQKIASALVSNNINSRKIDSLKQIRNQLNSEMMRASSSYRKSIGSVSPSLSNLRAILGENEVAIEFVNYELGYYKNANQGEQYAAIIIRGGEGDIEFIPLFKSSELGGLLSDYRTRGQQYVEDVYKPPSARGIVTELEQSKSLYELIWEPLEGVLDDVKTIYYSPSGLIHRLNMSALELQENIFLVQEYNLVPLLSTGSIVSVADTDDVEVASAYIVGGVDFDNYLIDSVGITGNKKNEIPLEKSIGFESVGRAYRNNSWPFLVHSATEVDEISKTLRNNSITVESYIGTSATEESFKTLGISAPSPSIIHLATHGFFFPDVDEEIKEKNRFVGSKNSMIRSGLIMAGGNKGWAGKLEGNAKEDGILTAFEISNMNLSNTDLVVMSACETGLGDIKGNEGVFGLQRAFKKAGVKNIIMTLWSVPDRQSQIFMKIFYKNWLESDMSLREAFRATQLDRLEEGWSTYQWGAFVLIE